MLVEDALKEVQESTEHALPKPSNEVRAVNRKRTANRPRHLTPIDFELHMDGCGVPSNFVKSNIRSDNTRHIIFATCAWLKLLAEAKTWYVNGTFKVIRKPFYQLLSVHSFFRSGDCIKQVPLAFILMNHRQAEDYTQVLNALKNSLPCVANLEEIVCDFETALWGAFAIPYQMFTYMDVIFTGHRLFLGILVPVV